VFAVLWIASTPLHAQSALERSPNLQGVWGLESGHPVFVLSHRFEILSGGDELFSVPTFTLAVGLPLRLTAGLDFTTFSEAIPDRLLGNEAQYWLKRPVRITPSAEVAVLGGYNSAASSTDGAISARISANRIQIFGESRFFSSLFGSGSAAVAGAVGAAARLTRHLALTADMGRVLTEDTVPMAWSAAIALEIPASPHTFSLQISNGGATTLHGASREKTVGGQAVRYGFTFTVPFGSRARWARIFRPTPLVPTPAEAGVHAAQIRQLAFLPGEFTIRRGETVEWINLDPVPHTVTAVDQSWNSGDLGEGERYRRAFPEVGQFTYYCIPHPEMRGMVVVVP
jgi:plastocyanin